MYRLKKKKININYVVDGYTLLHESVDIVQHERTTTQYVIRWCVLRELRDVF